MTAPVRLYQPSSGTEGALFFDAFCRHCARDRAMREGIELEVCDDDEVCPLIANSMAYNPHDDGYPQEWRYVNGKPTCTAFVPAGSSIPAPRCEHTADMFEGAAL